MIKEKYVIKKKWNESKRKVLEVYLVLLIVKVFP